MRCLATLAAFLVSLLVIPTLCLAQALADRVPADAKIYIGWNGTDSPGAGYDQSHLKAVLDASQLPQFVRESIPQLLDRLASENPRVRMVRVPLDVLMTLGARPAAFYFGGVDASNPNNPLPKIALYCDMGNGTAAQALGDKINNLLQQAPGNPFHCDVVDRYVTVADFTVASPPANPLSGDKDFQAALAPLGANPLGAAYINGTALLATINQLVVQFAPPEAQQQWSQGRDALGLDGLKSIAATAGFDGKNWMVQAAVAAPSPRHGLLWMGDAQPIGPEVLKLIPQTVTVAAAGSCDLDGVFTVIDHAVTQLTPDQGQQFHQGLQQVNQMLGFDIQHDLLGALGTQWASYVDPATGGDGFLGLTIVNRARNAERLDASLSSLANVANALIQQQLISSHPRITVEIRAVPEAGTTVHYLATPFISPSWAVKNGTLYLALYPQIVVAALDRPADAPSIQDNADFQSVMQKLKAPEKYDSFSFSDLPKTMPLGYQTTLALSRLYLGLGDLFGLQSPAMVLPPLDKIMAEVEPAGSVSWSDDTGYYAKAMQPFPGAEAMGMADIGPAGIGMSALMASIMLPSLNRARETANMVKSASNLRQIGQGILLYSDSHNGAYPPDLGTLVKTEDLTAAVFVAPSGDQSPPPNMTADEAADWVNQHSDYVYAGAGMKQGVDPQVVVAYEKMSVNHGRGINLLFGDGHVEFMNMPQAQAAIQRGNNPPGGGM